MAEKLITSFKIGEDDCKVDYNSLVNQPAIPEDKNDKFRKLILKVAGHDKEDLIIKDEIYNDYPRITIEVGEHLSNVRVFKGKADKEGVLEMPAIEPNVYVSYDKDCGFYTNKDDKETDSKGKVKEIGQFNMKVFVEDGYELDASSIITSPASGVYNNIKLNTVSLDKLTSPVSGDVWVNATQVKGNFTITITAKEHVEQAQPPEGNPVA